MRRGISAGFVFLSVVASGRSLARPSEPWPCPGCLVHVPARLPDGPRPLLVALHGDGGAVRPLAQSLEAACDAAGVILLAPRCPVELGCSAGSYWQWLANGRHDDRWLSALVEAMAERHVIDRARVYATGFSGGATYLGYWIPRHPTLFAAVAHLGGGARYGAACPACKVPVLFLMGSLDPMIGLYTGALRAYWEGCAGHEVLWRELPGVTHEGTLAALRGGRAHDVISWLLQRRARCAEVTPGPIADAGPSDAGSTEGPPAAVVPAAPAVVASTKPPAAPPAPSSMPRARRPAGCLCHVAAAEGQGSGLAWVLLGIVTVARRSGSCSTRSARVAVV